MDQSTKITKMHQTKENFCHWLIFPCYNFLAFYISLQQLSVPAQSQPLVWELLSFVDSVSAMSMGL